MRASEADLANAVAPPRHWSRRLISRVKSAARGMLLLFVRALPAVVLERSLHRLIALRADALPPAESLRFHFGLDTALYALE